MMGKLWDAIDGNKTYILAFAGGILTILHSLKYIDDETFATLMGLLGSAGLATLRHAVGKDNGKPT